MPEQQNYDFTKIIPSTEVIDLTKLEPTLATREGFSSAVMNLGCSKNLPKLFPSIPNISNTKVKGVVMNEESRENLLSLPKELYDSETYKLDPRLRGPLEEILLINERERAKCGFTHNQLLGDGWSEHFKERFNKFKPKVGFTELNIFLDEKGGKKDKKDPEGLKGSRIG